MSETTEERAKRVLADVFGLDAGAIASDTSVDTIEAWDSLQHLNVVIALEEEFGIGFTDEETITLTTLPLIVAIVDDHLAS